MSKEASQQQTQTVSPYSTRKKIHSLARVCRWCYQPPKLLKPKKRKSHSLDLPITSNSVCPVPQSLPPKLISNPSLPLFPPAFNLVQATITPFLSYCHSGLQTGFPALSCFPPTHYPQSSLPFHSKRANCLEIWSLPTSLTSFQPTTTTSPPHPL